MKLLSWDTSSKAGAIAAIEWDENHQRSGFSGVKLVAEWSLNTDATQSEGLLWGIHRVLESAQWKLSDIDCFGVGVGPGSFTGLRIGMTTARTLAHTLGKPLVGVSSLAALARPAALWIRNVLGPKKKAYVIATTDACKGELFALWGIAGGVVDCTTMSSGDFPGVWKRGVEEKVIEPEKLMKTLKAKIGSSPWIAIGEGRNRYLDQWKVLPKKNELSSDQPFLDQVQGRYVACLAWEAYQAGLARDPLKIHPRYLRASDAEIKLKAGLLKTPTRYQK